MERSNLASNLASILVSWGYGPSFAQSLTLLARPDLAPARVISDLGSHLEIADAAGAPRLAQLSGRLRHTLFARDRPVVGDWVAIAAAALDEPAVVHHILPRASLMVRRAAGRADHEQVIAANVDTCLIVTSANRDASPRRLERYLTAVWDSGAAPVVVVSKTDLVTSGELAAVLAALAAVAPGVPIIPVSVHLGAGMAALADHLQPRRTVALLGSSGVGKSSLLNCWLGHDHQVVLPIDADERGRHTTTRRELFALPGGALVIDTPGMRSFGLLATDSGLGDAFADVAELATGCRFRDCQHRGEPGCAVDAAIGAGEFDAGRLDGLHKLGRELAAAELRRDPQAAREQRARMKIQNRALRARTRIDPKRQR